MIEMTVFYLLFSTFISNIRTHLTVIISSKVNDDVDGSKGAT